MTQQIYPFMYAAYGTNIMPAFNNACAAHNLTLTVTNADQSAELRAASTALCQSNHPNRDIKPWVDACYRKPGFTAFTLTTPNLRVVALCWLRSVGKEDLTPTMQTHIARAAHELHIPLDNQVYCQNLVVSPNFQNQHIGSGLTWIARHYIAMPDGMFYLSRIKPGNTASIAAATKTGRASTGIYDREVDKYLWWGIIPPKQR